MFFFFFRLFGYPGSFFIQLIFIFCVRQSCYIFSYFVPFDIFVMYCFTALVLLLVARSDSTPMYFGHLDPDINCVFDAIGRYYCLLCLFILVDVYE